MIKSQIIELIGVVLAFIGTLFCPWATLSSYIGSSPLGWWEIAPLSSIFSVIFIIIVLDGCRTQAKGGGIEVMIGGILGFLNVVWYIINEKAFISSLEDEYTIIIITNHDLIGRYLTLTGFLIAFIGGILQYKFFKNYEKAYVKLMQSYPPPPLLV